MPNLHPTISADALACYLLSPPTRRQALLERAKYGDVLPDPYARARELGRQILVGASPGSFNGPGAAFLANLAEWRAPAEIQVQPLPESPLLKVGGVAITEPVDALLVSKHGSVGGVALAFEPVTERMARARSALMALALLESGPAIEASHRYMVPSSAIVDREVCIVLDLVSGATHAGPREHARILRDIEAACDEIRRMWSSV